MVIFLISRVLDFWKFSERLRVNVDDIVPLEASHSCLTLIFQRLIKLVKPVVASTIEAGSSLWIPVERLSLLLPLLPLLFAEVVSELAVLLLFEPCRRSSFLVFDLPGEPRRDERDNPSDFGVGIRKGDLSDPIFGDLVCPADTRVLWMRIHAHVAPTLGHSCLWVVGELSLVQVG